MCCSYVVPRTSAAECETRSNDYTSRDVLKMGSTVNANFLSLTREMCEVRPLIQYVELSMYFNSRVSRLRTCSLFVLDVRRP